MALINVEELTLSYENMAVIEGLSFRVERGDYLCIVGENGSGKSTLVKALLSLKKPERGGIIFGDKLKKNEIGYLPQQTGAQKNFPASVFEVVLSGCLSGCGRLPFYSKKQKQTAYRNMKKLGIAELKNRSYRELSGGQQQRVLLSRALCAAGKLILLDEPVTGLDPIITAEFYDLVNKINSEGTAVIMVTHDLSAAAEYASHILFLREKEYFFGTRDEFLKSGFSKLAGAARGARDLKGGEENG